MSGVCECSRHAGGEHQTICNAGALLGPLGSTSYSFFPGVHFFVLGLP